MSPPQASCSGADRPSDMKGTVRTGSGNPDPTASVLVFPVEQANWVDTDRSRVESRLRAPARTAASPSARCRRVNTTWWRSRNRPRGTGRTRRLDAIARSATTVRIGEGESRVVTLLQQGTRVMRRLLLIVAITIAAGAALAGPGRNAPRPTVERYEGRREGSRRDLGPDRDGRREPTACQTCGGPSHSHRRRTAHDVYGRRGRDYLPTFR